MKRFLSFLLLTVLLCGCSAAGQPQEEIPIPDVVLRYYSIGREDPDLPLVSEKLNELFVKRYGFGVDYRRLDFNTYENVMNTIINTDQEFDVMFTWDSHYVQNASQGAFLDLTPYLEKEAYSLYNTVDQRLWQGVTLQDKIFGVPTNKELAPVVQFLFSKDLVDKYHINTAKYRSLHALEPLLAMIHREEPQAAPLVFTSERVNLAQLVGYEYVAGGNLPFVVKQGDPVCRVCNIYETEEMQDLMETLRRFYKLGYINEDAVLRTAISRFEDEEVFCRIAVGGPESAGSFSMDFGYPIVTMAASKPWITNASARGGIMAINARSPHKEEALTFLTAVNLDPDVRNLLNYGVEGVHYSLTDKDQVHFLTGGYRGVPYTQGNWFILKTMEGENPKKWKNYQIYNNQAETSCLLGFEPDLTGLEIERNQVAQIYLRYDNALLTGSADPSVYLERALRQMDISGADKIQKQLQSQVDDWLKNTEAAK